MKYFVKWACTGMKAEGKSTHIEDEISRQIGIIEKSGKLKEGGAILGKGGGGYFVFELERYSELLSLLGRVFWENFEVEVHPVVSYKEIGEYMTKEYKKAA